MPSRPCREPLFRRFTRPLPFPAGRATRAIRSSSAGSRSRSHARCVRESADGAHARCRDTGFTRAIFRGVLFPILFSVRRRFPAGRPIGSPAPPPPAYHFSCPFSGITCAMFDNGRATIETAARSEATWNSSDLADQRGKTAGISLLPARYPSAVPTVTAGKPFL